MFSVATAFECGVLIDGIADEPLSDAVVLVEDGEVADVDRVGMSEMEALKAGTSGAAEALPAEGIGAIQPDYQADLVALDESPLDDISNVRTVNSVYKAGEKQPV